MSDISRQISCAVGISAANENLRAVVLRNGTLSDRHEVLIDENTDFVQQILDFSQNLKQTSSDAQVFGVAFPGLIKNQVGEVSYSVQFPSIRSFDLRQRLESGLQIPVFIENDANAGVFAEYHFGAGRGTQSLFYASFGKGVGGALMFKDKVWRGAHGFAGEFGHIIADENGTTLEDVASARGIIRRSKERLLADNTSSLSKLENRFTLKDLIEASQNGDDFAQMMIERTGVYVGTGIASVINMLDVERVIINGDILTADEIFINAVRESAKKWAFEPLWQTTQIVSAELGSDAVVIGAALAAMYSENAK